MKKKKVDTILDKTFAGAFTYWYNFPSKKVAVN